MYPQYISKYIIKYPRTYPNPEIIYSYLVRICSSIFPLIQQAYWINPSEIFSFFSLAIAPLRINRRGPVFRERCSKRGVLFSLAARATCGFPSPLLQARGFRYLEERLEGGEGRKIVLFRKESTATVRGKRFQSPPELREKKRDWSMFWCQGYRGEQLRFANNTGFSPSSRSSQETGLKYRLFLPLFPIVKTFSFSRKIIIK